MVVDIDTLLAWGGCYKTLKAGDIVFREEATCYFYYQLVSGCVKWVNIDDEGNEFIQHFVGPGNCFGELPIFDDEPYTASAIAESDSVVIYLQKPVFKELLKQRPALHFTISKLMAQRLRYKFQLSKELAYHNPEQCIAFLLSYLKQTHQYVCDKCNKVNLTRQQIAGMTGLRVETVIRAIRSLHQKGELLIDKGKVYC